MKKRILTGDRPTGRLHIGHFAGSLQNRVKLQTEFETFVLIADLQALTTHFENPELIRQSVFDVALDNLAVGLDTENSTLILQSAVPAIAELTVLLGLLVSVNTLRHNPTVKSEAIQYGYGDLSYGFLGYPVSQAADITFCGADLVPVGEDQLPHLELARKLVRRFSSLYSNVLKEPEFLLSDCSRLVGLDGNAKMSKSLNNAIFLSDPPEIVKDRVNSALTDPNRIHVKDRGNPASCVVSIYHKTFNEQDYLNLCEMCRVGSIGCVACKRRLTEKLNLLLAPFRERRSYYEAHEKLVKDFVRAGSQKACGIGNETLTRVKDAMKLTL